MMPPLVDVDRAQITRTGDGRVVIDDPESPLLIEMTMGVQRTITSLTISVRHPYGAIGRRALARIPIGQMARLAAAQLADKPHPNEQFYWQLAQQTRRQAGKAQLSREHLERVLTVYRWAEETGRPGGGHQAVADMWGVTRQPTSYRWLRQARALSVMTVSAGDPAVKLAGAADVAG